MFRIILLDTRSFAFKNFLWIMAGIISMNSYGQAPNSSNPPHSFGPAGNIIKCYSTEYETHLQQQNPKRLTPAKFEQWMASRTAAMKAKRISGLTTFGVNQVVTIPVVVHIIHNGDAVGTNENITNEQVYSQITVLNQDFRKQFDTPGFNNNPVGADSEIEFCLAQRDPNGLATTGIVRYNLGTNEPWSITTVDASLKPHTIWDPEQYLNIWVVNDVNIYPGGFGPLAGYAQFPVNSTLHDIDSQPPAEAETDGVVIAAQAFGSVDIYFGGNYWPGYEKGRTTTHEVGHFFGLRHIWGDGDCSASDYCADTPNAAGPNSGCPANLDSCPDSPGLDMIENYMDYTNNTCMNIFTLDQKDRMQVVLANSPRRASLITSQGCIPGTIHNLDGSINIDSINLSPCSDILEPTIVVHNAGNTILTSATITYNIDGQNSETIEWTGNLAYGQETIVTLDETTALPGQHTINAGFTSINSGTDDLAANNTFSASFNVDATYAATSVVVKVKTDNAPQENIWAILDSNGNFVASNATNPADPLGSNSYVIPNHLYTHNVPLAANKCYSFLIVDLGGNGISGDGFFNVTTPQGNIITEDEGFISQHTARFGINGNLGAGDFDDTLNNIVLYPNPANELLTLNIPETNMLPDSYIITNSIGQQIGNGTIEGHEQNIDVSHFANGVYFIKVKGLNGARTLQFIKK